MKLAPKRLARIAGLFYLGVIVFGVFANLVVRTKIYVPGDATASAANIAAETMLFRFGFVADIFMAVSFLFLSFALYLLLKHVNKSAARSMVVFVAIGVGMILVNLLYHFAALLVATDSAYAAALGEAGANAMTLLLLDMHFYGYYIAGVFFGLWLLPLGYLAYKSGMFPRLLSTLLIVAAFAHLLGLLILFLLPDSPEVLALVVSAPAVVAEFWMAGYLVVKGVKNS